MTPQPPNPQSTNFKPFTIVIDSPEMLHELMNDIAISTDTYDFTFGDLWDTKPENEEAYSELLRVLKSYAAEVAI